MEEAGKIGRRRAGWAGRGGRLGWEFEGFSLEVLSSSPYNYAIYQKYLATLPQDGQSVLRTDEGLLRFRDETSFHHRFLFFGWTISTSHAFLLQTFVVAMDVDGKKSNKLQFKDIWF